MIREFRLKGGEKILAMIRQFSATEKVIFGILSVVLVVTALGMLIRVNDSFSVAIPAHGGTLTEGVIGLPRLINPIIAISDVDRDLSTLIFAGLLRSENGKLVPDIAQSYTVSDDGLTYTFKIRDDVRFHDGEQLTTDDVEFTIAKIQDPSIQSPRRVDWKDTQVKKIDATTIQFTLKQPYAPFINNFTVGIIPKHLWKDVDAAKFILSENNIEPIGAGPYKLSSINPDAKSVPTAYNLSAFNTYPQGGAYISNIVIKFYPNEKDAADALHNGSINSLASVSPKEAAVIASSTTNTTVLSTPLPRIFAVFLNQSNTLFANKEIRFALAHSVDKDTLVHNVLNGYGVAIDSPVPSGSLALSTANTESDEIFDATSTIQHIRDTLEKAGWKLGSDGVYTRDAIKDKKNKKITTPAQTFEFAIATADSPDLKQTAEFVKSAWAKIGARVTINVFESGDLTQEIIRNRKYDALLFGEIIGKDLDLYAFWHSSQRNSPGLNLSMYANSKVDKLLEDARKSSNEDTRLAKYADATSIIQDDLPAVFLYSPNFIYITPKQLQGNSLDHITAAWDRWNTVAKWYINTENVWKIFAK
jgi:peptide/nickel transport system substrate-binding protein